MSDFLEIIPKDAKTDDEPDVQSVLQAALDSGQLDYVLLLGQRPTGEWYFAASDGDVARATFTADHFKNFILEMTK